ncbi:lysozyme inhibitor LprI family protein [Burkholderia pseudomallei]|uniref:lysozyme inhibitor LprI family protein n=1 Tax=Burkholderia pseudomallei TaxID=28450 RepID=UPI000F06F82D|nr:lysozyme inhibitor LprI family protein [Burkholderia pseudomallei]
MSMNKAKMMMNIRKSTGAVWLSFTGVAYAALFSIAAHAATLTKADPVKACFDRAQGQEQEAACYEQAINVQKKRINAAYNKLIKHRQGDPARIDALNKLQKGWIAWRDQTNNYLNSNVAGNGYTVFVVSEGFLLDAATKQADLLETVRDVEGGE